jgi:hypothetical protein
MDDIFIQRHNDGYLFVRATHGVAQTLQSCPLTGYLLFRDLLCFRCPSRISRFYPLVTSYIQTPHDSANHSKHNHNFQGLLYPTPHLRPNVIAVNQKQNGSD